MRRIAWNESLFFLALCLVFASGCAPALGAEQREWKAEWISHPTAPLRDPITLHFKKSFVLSASPAHFIIHVSADNRFILYLNGARVGDGPARGDLAHWRYETFDLAPLLKPGPNTLAATVWNFGIFAPVAQLSDRTAFLVEGDTTAEAAVNTDATWSVELESGQLALPRHSGGLDGYMAAGPGETLRASLYDWEWKQPGTAGSQWTQATSAMREKIYPAIATSAGVTAENPWSLIADPLPHMAYTSEDPGHTVRSSLPSPDSFPGSFPASFPVSPTTIPAKTHAHILLDRAELTTAYPTLHFSGGNGSRIQLTYSEALYDEQQHKGNRSEVATRQALGLFDEIFPDGGLHRTFEPLWWRTWRYLDLDITTAEDSLTLDGLEAHFTAYPFEVKASFQSSDPDLQKIWKIGWHTAQLDAHETYMDTPYWEQLQYSGDTRIQAMITYTMTGTGLLPQQAIRALNDSRIPDGITASRYPSSIPQYIPPFSLLWIGMIHDNYMYRTDTTFLKEMLPGTRTVLDWFASYQHADGVLGKLPWWSFIDWIETETAKPFPSYDANNESCLTTMQYIGALEEAIDLEKALGSPQYAAMDSSRLYRAKQGVRTQCWNAKNGLFSDNETKDTYSEHTNMLAVLYDVIPKKDQPALMHKVAARRIDGSDGTKPIGNPPLIGASFYFRYYLARALDHAGMADEYLNTLGDWRGFLKQGFTTWPEQPGNTRSDSHAWTAHPTSDLLTLVAGIAPGSPGFKTVRIAPHLGNLTSLEATMPHDKGLIRVKYAVSGVILHADLDLPDGLTGDFVWKRKTTPLRSGKTTLNLK